MHYRTGQMLIFAPAGRPDAERAESPEAVLGVWWCLADRFGGMRGEGTSRTPAGPTPAAAAR